MVSTKHCCWGKCTSDSRYPEKLHKSLKELRERGEEIFIPFPKPSRGLEKCAKWVQACSRGEQFTVAKITRNTYICRLHWPGQKGPTVEFPDPLKAKFTAQEIHVTKASKRKRKPPLQRRSFSSKRKRLEQEKQDIESETELCTGGFSESIQDLFPPSENNDKGTQTEISRHELSSKVETITMGQNPTTNIVSNLAYEIIVKDSNLMKHFVGLTAAQFGVLHNFLSDVCPLDTITYWKCMGSNSGITTWSTREQLYICLLRLKTGFTIKTLAILLSCPGRQIKETTIRNIFTIFIQLMYKVFRDMEEVMFPPKEHLQRFLPRVFKTIKNIRCSVDCIEFRVQTLRNFAQEGNTYSQYKHSNTFKCLIAVTPNGGACFVSDLFEGDINDVQIFKESGILKHIQPNDMILVDRGFTVQDLVNPLQARIKIPAFLEGRGSLSAAEELSTRKNAKARVHVERFNKRLKVFKLIRRTIPLSLSPLATQMVVVACGLVNFQEVLCK